MPALPAVPSTLRVAVKGDIDAQSPWLSRLFITYTGTAPTSAQLNTFCSTAMSSAVTNLIPLIDTSARILEIDATDLTSPTAAVGNNVATHVGTRAGTQMDAAACAVISYSILRRYRGGHPRGYWRFGTVSDITSGRQWTGTATAAFKSGFDAWITALLAAGWTGAGTLTHTNVSYYSGNTVVISPTTGRARNVPVLRGTPLIDTVAGTIAQAFIGTQRRRIEFIG